MQLFGHSFISYFKRFIRTNASDFDYNLNLDKREVMIQFSSYPGASVEGSSDVYDFEPDLVILDIGTKDLSSSPPETVANAIVSLVNSLLCTTYDKNLVTKVSVLPIRQKMTLLLNPHKLNLTTHKTMSTKLLMNLLQLTVYCLHLCQSLYCDTQCVQC